MANRGKEILFLCLAVTALTVAIQTFRGNPGSRYTSPRMLAQTEASRAEATRGGKAESPPPAPRPPLEPRGETSPLNRNPFSRPVGAPSAAPKPEPEAKPTELAAAPAAPRVEPRPQPSPAPVVMPPLTLQTPPMGTTATSNPAPSGPQLTGIVGDRSGYQMAVIRLGDRRYFAKAGDKVAGRYLVQSVSDRQVVLAGSEGKLILKRGGSQ